MLRSDEFPRAGLPWPTLVSSGGPLGFRRRFAHEVGRSQERLWKLELDRRRQEAIIVVIGLGWVVLGIVMAVTDV